MKVALCFLNIFIIALLGSHANCYAQSTDESKDKIENTKLISDPEIASLTSEYDPAIVELAGAYLEDLPRSQFEANLKKLLSGKTPKEIEKLDKEMQKVLSILMDVQFRDVAAKSPTTARFIDEVKKEHLEEINNWIEKVNGLLDASKYDLLFPGSKLKQPVNLFFNGLGTVVSDRAEIAKFGTNGNFKFDDVITLGDGEDASMLILDGQEDFDFYMNGNFSALGCTFFLIGWDQGNGYLLYNLRIRSNCVWRLVYIQNFTAIEASRKNLSNYRPKGESKISIEVKDSELTCKADNESLATNLPLDLYKPGEVLFGITGNQYGPKKISISEIAVLRGSQSSKGIQKNSKEAMTRERNARAELQLAQSAIEEGLIVLAKKFLTDITNEYTDTSAAKEGRELLRTLSPE